MEIKGHDVEFVENGHIYLVDGVIVPSITQILKVKFKNKYSGVDTKVLERASINGTAVHKAIENYEKYKIESACKELRNYKFLKKAYEFECIGNEIPLILFKDGEPFACGTTDMLIIQKEKIGLGDIKRTSTLDKNYLAYQLNLYRTAYQQCYNQEIEFLRGIHLRDDVRKFIEIPINEQIAWDLIDEYIKEQNNGKY